MAIAVSINLLKNDRGSQSFFPRAIAVLKLYFKETIAVLCLIFKDNRTSPYPF
ncbi:MAG: hypothetical protein VKL42_09905 [Snowella sp.]|nr:hypothetical protein [Snowella sp.]